MNLVVVYNPKSGTAVAKQELDDMFNQAGHTVEAFLDVTDNVETTLQPWIDQSMTVAAIGGDGTVSSIAQLLVGTNCVFAPLPGGTLNHFTKDLGITQDLQEAINALTDAAPKAIDIATVNGVNFVNNSSIGLYPSSLHDREELTRKNVNKWTGAVIASIRAFIRYRTYTVTIGNETFKTPFLFVGNNDYHLETLNGGGRTTINEGLLSAYIVASTSRLSLLHIVGRAVIGKLETADDVKVWKATKLVIHTKRSNIRISRDGELEQTTSPLTYEIIAGGLTVIGSS